VWKLSPTQLIEHITVFFLIIIRKSSLKVSASTDSIVSGLDEVMAATTAAAAAAAATAEMTNRVNGSSVARRM